MVDAESLEGKEIIIKNQREEIGNLRRQVGRTEAALDSLVKANKALVDGKTDEAAGLVMRAITELRAEF